MIRRDPGKAFVITKSTKVCSDHFLPEDFADQPGAVRRILKPSAFPCVFKWTSSKGKRRLTRTSLKAAVTGPGDCCDFDSDTLACAETEEHSCSVSPCCDMLEPEGGCFREDSSDNLRGSDKVDALQAEVRRLEHR